MVLILKLKYLNNNNSKHIKIKNELYKILLLLNK